ncbi:Hypothetical protein CINCED_3A002973 [Cinara cedri]|uniref:Uncharacterized protein n=1 Tax=Cinara cedri TaxID=506608 RepID=A0A5E4MNR1_9HEMI|nr:Hypothetical protein CINCED_3A002973 [Cinara cedri]
MDQMTDSNNVDRKYFTKRQKVSLDTISGEESSVLATLDSKIGSGDAYDRSSTKKALRRGYKALLRMRVAALRSAKSLARQRMPAHTRRDMEKRYADLMKRVAVTTVMIDAAVADADKDNDSAVRIDSNNELVLHAASLLASVYSLERKLNAIVEERDRLVAGETNDEGLGHFIRNLFQ